jgi:hypothetical protein
MITPEARAEIRRLFFGVAQERLPCLRRRTSRARRRLRDVLRHRVLIDRVTELREPHRDPAATPRRVFVGHPLDERHELVREQWPPEPALLVRPETREPAAVPCDHRRGLHDR